MRTKDIFFDVYVRLCYWSKFAVKWFTRIGTKLIWSSSAVCSFSLMLVRRCLCRRLL